MRAVDPAAWCSQPLDDTLEPAAVADAEAVAAAEDTADSPQVDAEAASGEIRGEPAHEVAFWGRWSRRVVGTHFCLEPAPGYIHKGSGVFLGFPLRHADQAVKHEPLLVVCLRSCGAHEVTKQQIYVVSGEFASL